MTTSVIFCARTNRIIDVLKYNEDGQAKLDRHAKEYGLHLAITGLDEASQRYEATFKREPVEISGERFHEMLGVLPPVAWRTSPADHESFKISERTAGTITAIFVRIGDRYFEMADSIFLPHPQCVTRVLERFFAQPDTTSSASRQHYIDTGRYLDKTELQS